jgi:hypothetical protein
MKSKILFLKSFLKKEVFLYLDTNGNSLEQLTVVMPNQKGFSFFQSFSFLTKTGFFFFSPQDTGIAFFFVILKRK